MIIQVNIWICEKCGKLETTIDQSDIYSDPIVLPPNNEKWDYIEVDGKELLCCQDCLEKTNMNDTK